MEKDLENLYELLKNYKTKDKQEKDDKEFMLWCLDNMPDLLTRKNDQFHFTSSAFIINKAHSKILAVYNIIHDSWSIVSGHADGIKNMLNVAIKEVKEETGLKDFEVLNKKMPVSIEKLLIDQHFKDDELVYEHYHLNFTYLLEINDELPLVINESENSDIKWMEFDEFLECVAEPKMLPIYKKIIERLK